MTSLDESDFCGLEHIILRDFFGIMSTGATTPPAPPIMKPREDGDEAALDTQGTCRAGRANQTRVDSSFVYERDGEYASEPSSQRSSDSDCPEESQGEWTKRCRTMVCACCEANGVYQRGCGISHECMRKGPCHNQKVPKTFACQYCGITKSSRVSRGKKGYKIRCPCRGIGDDGKPKMHVIWRIISDDKKKH